MKNFVFLLKNECFSARGQRNQRAFLRNEAKCGRARPATASFRFRRVCVQSAGTVTLLPNQPKPAEMVKTRQIQTITSCSIRLDPTESDPKHFAELIMKPPTHCKCMMAVAAPAMATHHALARSWSGQGSRNAHGGERTIHQENQPVAVTMQSLRSFFPVLSPSMNEKS